MFFFSFSGGCSCTIKHNYKNSYADISYLNQLMAMNNVLFTSTFICTLHPTHTLSGYSCTTTEPFLNFLICRGHLCWQALFLAVSVTFSVHHQVFSECSHLGYFVSHYCMAFRFYHDEWLHVHIYSSVTSSSTSVEHIASAVTVYICLS